MIFAPLQDRILDPFSALSVNRKGKERKGGEEDEGEGQAVG